MTSFKCKYLNANSKCYQDLDLVPKEKYDLMISSANWDQRSTAVTKLKNIHVTCGLQVVFSDRDQDGRQEKNEKKLAEWMKSNCDRYISLKFKTSNNSGSFWDMIKSAIGKNMTESNYPLKVFIDLTILPRYYSLGLLVSCMSIGLTEKMTYFYAEASYEDQDNEVTQVFHKGSWAALPIPGLEASYDPGKKKYYLVSAGFEGDSTMRVVSTDDPDRVSLLFPKPGFKETYEAKTLSANQALIDAYAIPATRIINARAGDAIEAWSVLCQENIEDTGTGNVFYLCCGTRPHSLALALRAMTAEFQPTVLYYVPDSYAITNIKENGKYWLYDIVDVSVIPKVS